MEISGTRIEDTFAEAFRMRYVRLIVTAHDEHWLDAALREFTGYSSSIISCDSETGLERRLSGDETPDGRVGTALLVFGFSSDGLAAVVPNRVGQCLMTCPTTAVYDGLSAGEKRIPLGKTIRYFGDGFQKSKLVGGRRFVHPSHGRRIPHRTPGACRKRRRRRQHDLARRNATGDPGRGRARFEPSNPCRE